MRDVETYLPHNIEKEFFVMPEHLASRRPGPEEISSSSSSSSSEERRPKRARSMRRSLTLEFVE